MDNRFNVKDIVMVVLVLTVGGLVGLGMWQNGRQWGVLQETLATIQGQEDAVNLYRRQLDEYKRGQDELRTGVQSLIEVLQQSASEGSGPRLAEGQIDLSEADFTEDPTFDRVARLRDKDSFTEGDYFIDMFGATVKNLTPFVAGDVYSTVIQEYVLDSLLTIDPNTLEHKPMVAESWEVSDDELTITYKLRRDVVFSDGEPLTADDVVFTYRWIMNPRVAAVRSRSYFEKLESVEALDDYTVRFTFREPYFLALTVTGQYLSILPEHWVSQFTEDEYNKLPGLLMGSGPYRMVEEPKDWQPGSQKIELVRNENYWGPRPALERVIWREILEPTAQLTAFRNRDVDRLGVRASMYRSLSSDEQLREQAQLYEYEYVSRGYSYIGWNQRRNEQATPFADKRVRQAMTLLIDREAIVGQIYENLARVATGPFHPLGWQADPSIDPWPYDPERAKELLTEAGYIDRNDDGIRESEAGAPLTFEFIHSASSPEAQQVAQLIRQSMRQAGVECKPEAMDWPVMQQKLDDRNFDAIMLGWGGAVETDIHQMFHSDQTEDGGDNYVYYRSPELDALIAKARKAVDREKGKVLWQQAHGILHEDQPYTFMMNPLTVVFFDRRLENIEVTKVGINRAWEYFVPGPSQLHTGN